ncbi:MAG: hypothetical protein JRJ84_22120 [Deltaproteobacteria bacterium]|nr:hypothetical protein [Deltaproteobacteria bacterium]
MTPTTRSPATSYLVVGFTSCAVVALEMAWTRVFSAEFFYTFAFLVLSLGVLGLGLGALSLRLLPSLTQKDTLGPILSLAALLGLASPGIVLHMGLDFSQILSSGSMLLRLASAIVLLGSTFAFAGVALALVFRAQHADMPRLYMADLVGAGLGVVLAVTGMNLFGTPVAAVLLCLPLVAAAFHASTGSARTLPIALLFGTLGFAFTADQVLEVPKEERAPVIHTHWDATAKIKIYEYDEDFRGINIDNAANSPLWRFDGDWDRPDREPFEFGISVANLMDRMEGDFTFLSLGSGGGTDVLQALDSGAAEIHAVEVIPHINHMMTKGDLAAYTGHIYADPRVVVVTEDARAYVRAHPDAFDIIFSLSSNSFAAMTSGAFALSESYLFTTEAFGDYWRALSERGFMMMEHQFYMPRLVTSALDALRHEGVADPTSHIAVYALPQMRRQVILLGKQPLTEEIRNNALAPLSPEIEEAIHLLYPAPEAHADNLIDRIVTQGWRSQYDEAPVDISPSTDDRPFPAQLGRWKNVDTAALEKVMPWEFMGFPISKLLICVVVGIALLLILPLNLLPYLRPGDRLRWRGWAYFGAIGAGFMIVEVVLIQRYALFIGPSAATMATLLCTLLIASGVGSRFAPRFGSRVPFLAIVAWLMLEIMFLRPLTDALGGTAMPLRIAITALLVFPLGFFMGMPFPKGTQKVGALVDWGFAINGATSVLGASAILLVAFAWGLDVALLVGVACYGVALAVIATPGAWWSPQKS